MLRVNKSVRTGFAAMLVAGAFLLALAPAVATAQGEKSEPSVEQRLADLEAYVNNTARAADAADATVSSKISGAGPGHNAWMMTSAALVLFMTLPGLALFYGGLVRTKNVLSVLAQCLGIAGLVTILWWAFGYSMVFARGGRDHRRHAERVSLRASNSLPNGDYSYWVSQNVFSMYQLMFAIITPALIIGAIAERMKFSAILLFVALWMFVVYFPLAHMVWGINGMMNGVWNADASIKAIDFAGGTVVHMSSGWSALVLCIILGKRTGFGKEQFAPHSMVLCMVGTGMLWVGWYGFNAGSAVAADGDRGQRIHHDHIGHGGGFVRLGDGRVHRQGQAERAGLLLRRGGRAGRDHSRVRFRDCPMPRVIIGILAGLIPFFACTKLKAMLGYDDALDTFGVHAVGGTLGAFMTGIFADAEANSNLTTNLKGIVGHTLWIEQLKAIVVTLVLAVVATVVLAYIVKALVGLRPEVEEERAGLDLTDHGESAYNY